MVIRILLSVSLAGVLVASVGCGKGESGASTGKGGQAGAPAETPGRDGAAVSVRTPAARVEHTGRRSAKTDADFAKVRVGMAEAEVKAIMGESTTSVEAAQADGKKVLTCAWEAGPKTYAVQFHDGKVAVITHGGGDQTAGKKDLRAKFAGVKVGMTIEEVRAAMGPPDHSTGAGDGQVFVWEDKSATYAVTFVDGKAAIVHSDGKGPAGKDGD